MTWRPERWGPAPPGATTDSEKLGAILAVVDYELAEYQGPEAMGILRKILDILTESVGGES